MNETTLARSRHRQTRTTATRYLLGALLFFIALNAFGGGWYGMTGAEAVPREWLDGSPFHGYFVPSLILFMLVGGASLVAAVASFADLRAAPVIALGAGAVLLGWIAIESVIIGYRSWLQPVTMMGALIVVALASLLTRERSGRSIPRIHA